MKKNHMSVIVLSLIAMSSVCYSMKNREERPLVVAGHKAEDKGDRDRAVELYDKDLHYKKFKKLSEYPQLVKAVIANNKSQERKIVKELEKQSKQSK